MDFIKKNRLSFASSAKIALSCAATSLASDASTSTAAPEVVVQSVSYNTLAPNTLPRSSNSSSSSSSSNNNKPALDSQGFPIPRSLSELVLMIREEMGDHGSLFKNTTSDHTPNSSPATVNIPLLQALMRNYKSTAQEWQQYAFHDKNRYTRNLIDDGNGQYNLLLLCWGPGQASPIHDHAGSHCLLKVMDGELSATLYDWPQQQHHHDQQSQNQKQKQPDIDSLHVKSSKLMHVNEVDYMHDKIGIHRVSNPSNTVPAVSLHLYSPPINMCTTFCENTGTPRKSGNCVFFSVRGKLLDWCNSSDSKKTNEQKTSKVDTKTSFTLITRCGEMSMMPDSKNKSDTNNG